MFKATVENLDSSISPRSISVVESRDDAHPVFPPPLAAVSPWMDVSKSPKGVTEDVDVDPDRSVELLDVGVRCKFVIERERLERNVRLVFFGLRPVLARAQV
jgi:hypothetical protein